MRAAQLGVLLGLAVAATTLPQVAHAAGASVTDATPEQKKAATDAFLVGRTAFEDGNLEAALKAFQDSYNQVASPNTHLMIGRTLRRLKREPEAYAAMNETAAEADALNDPKYKAAADAARGYAKEIEALIGIVTVQPTDAAGGPLVSGVVTVAGKKVDPRDWGKPIPLKPGSVSVTLESAGQRGTKMVEVAAGTSQTVQIKPGDGAVAPKPVPEEGDKSSGGFLEGDGTIKRPLAFGAAGLGVASLITFGVLGGLSSSKFSDLEAACPNGVCPPGSEDDIDSGRGLQTGANIMLGVGIAGLAAGAALFVLSMPEDDDGGDAPAAAWKRTQITFGAGSVGVRGTF